VHGSSRNSKLAPPLVLRSWEAFYRSTSLPHPLPLTAALSATPRQHARRVATAGLHVNLSG